MFEYVVLKKNIFDFSTAKNLKKTHHFGNCILMFHNLFYFILGGARLRKAQREMIMKITKYHIQIYHFPYITFILRQFDKI